MSFMDWVGTVGAIWLAVSILVGICWALAGKRIFRKPPQPPRPEPEMDQRTANAILDFCRYDAEMRGRK